jgi:hypothetical protein
MKARIRLARRAAACLAALLLTAAASPEPVAPAEHRRGPEQTFLTYPEWFLVHSPAEYAAFVQDRPPSDFPFLGHIGQFWEGYGAVTEATKPYPFNLGYHVMIMVIGVSTTVEYALRSAYETLAGRLAELTRRHGMTEEDRYAARIAQDYVDFIRVQPWYEYDFRAKLAGLWTQTGLWGPDAIRKWERKYALTTEYAAKALYGWVILRATKASYEDPLPLTAVLVDRVPPAAADALPEMKLLRAQPDGTVLVTVPRDAAFNRHAATLAAAGAKFQEIAGNRGAILVSVLGPANASLGVPPDQVLLAQPILTQPPMRRLLVAVPVEQLDQLLRDAGKAPFRVEHVYDY